MEKRFLAILLVLCLLPTTVLAADASTNNGNSTGNGTIITAKQCGKTVTFMYKGATSGVKKYQWFFGDGSKSISGKSLSKVVHKYKKSGRYVVNLYVQKANGKWIHVKFSFKVK
jgi:PKD repeat protein